MPVSRERRMAAARKRLTAARGSQAQPAPQATEDPTPVQTEIATPAPEQELVAAAPKPRSLKTLKRAKAAPAPEPEAAPETQVPTDPEQEAAGNSGALVTADVADRLSKLPSASAPARNVEPERSYKLPLGSTAVWNYSDDGGKTKHDAGTDQVQGIPIDLAMVVSKAKKHDGFDMRLRLAFIEDAGGKGRVAELNLNGSNTSRDGETYMTAPARSLLGALLSASESEDDMVAFADGVRFRVISGNRANFVGMDVNAGGSWVEMSHATATQRVPKDISGYLLMFKLVKSRLCGMNLMATNTAVIGEIEELEQEHRDEFPVVAVETTAEVVD